MSIALREIRDAIDEYKRASDRGVIASKGAENGYPPNLEALVDGSPDARASDRQKIHYFLRRIPRDPFADPLLPAEQTWRLRSYASPPNKPMPGADVYDVHSSSDGIALDGSTYASW